MVYNKLEAMIRFRKILLFNPPNVEQGGYTPSPLGLLYLAGYLRKNKKLKIKVVDAARLGKRSAIDALKNFNPDLVGISTLTPGRQESLKLASTDIVDRTHLLDYFLNFCAPNA